MYVYTYTHNYVDFKLLPFGHSIIYQLAIGYWNVQPIINGASMVHIQANISVYTKCAIKVKNLPVEKSYSNG